MELVQCNFARWQFTLMERIVAPVSILRRRVAWDVIGPPWIFYWRLVDDFDLLPVNAMITFVWCSRQLMAVSTDPLVSCQGSLTLQYWGYTNHWCALLYFPNMYEEHKTVRWETNKKKPNRQTNSPMRVQGECD